MNNITNVAIFGVGAAGSNTFLNLLYAYPGLSYLLVDNDIVEGRNVDPGTQPYTKTDLRRPKVQALQRIAMMSKKKRVVAKNKRILDVTNIYSLINDPRSTLIIDAFDNAKSRNFFTELSAEYNVLHIGFSAGLTGEAVWEDVFTPMQESKGDADIDVCEITLSRPFIIALCAMATISIGRFIEKGEKVNLYLDAHFNIKHW